MTHKLTLSLDEHVRHGETQLLLRARLEDKRDIAKAAAILGLTQSQFMRNVLIQTARMVIAEYESEAT